MKSNYFNKVFHISTLILLFCNFYIFPYNAQGKKTSTGYQGQCGNDIKDVGEECDPDSNCGWCGGMCVKYKDIIEGFDENDPQNETLNKNCGFCAPFGVCKESVFAKSWCDGNINPACNPYYGGGGGPPSSSSGSISSSGSQSSSSGSTSSSSGLSTIIFCGDSMIDPPEECDPPGIPSILCANNAVCEINCKCPPISPPIDLPLIIKKGCGNNLLDPGEECEPPNQPSPSCANNAICDQNCKCPPPPLDLPLPFLPNPQQRAPVPCGFGQGGKISCPPVSPNLRCDNGDVVSSSDNSRVCCNNTTFVGAGCLVSGDCIKAQECTNDPITPPAIAPQIAPTPANTPPQPQQIEPVPINIQPAPPILPPIIPETVAQPAPLPINAGLVAPPIIPETVAQPAPLPINAGLVAPPIIPETVAQPAPLPVNPPQALQQP